MAQWYLGMAEVNFFHGKSCGKAGRTTIFRKAGWLRELFLARNCIAQHCFHQRGSSSRVQTAGSAILKQFCVLTRAIDRLLRIVNDALVEQFSI